MRSLRVRLSLLSLAVLAIVLGVSVFLAYEVISFAGRQAIDAGLREEQRRFERLITAFVQEDLAQPGQIAQPATTLLERAVARYFDVSAPAPAQLLSVTVGAESLTSDGPAELRAVLDGSQLPEPPSGTDGQIESVATSGGPVRALWAPIFIGQQQAGSLRLLASLQPVAQAAAESVVPMTLVAVISLLLGGALLVVVLFRTLAPLRSLAVTAREIELRDLSRRVPERGRSDEIGILAREFNRMIARLEVAVAEQRAFMGAVSHELRTPITIARGHIETLERSGTDDPEAVAEVAAIVGEELQRVGRLVEDLMALARSTTEDFVVRQPLQLPVFFDDLRLRLTGLHLENVELTPPPALMVYADRDRLAQAMLNLIVNAVVHNPPGTAVKVGAGWQGAHLLLWVRDDGRGIDPELKERIFEPWVSSGGDGGRKSSGLGLMVVNAVVTAHGGSIDVETSVAGTVVMLRLPLDGTRLSGAGASLGNGRNEADEDTAIGLPVMPGADADR